ncbi:hypothetical protein H0H87_000440, partial [Tephrocybe sp. NHM501043]
LRGRHVPVYELSADLRKNSTQLEDKHSHAEASASLDIEDLKQSNHPLTSSQTSVVKSVLASKNQDLTQLDVTILTLQLQINDSLIALRALEEAKSLKQLKANSVQSCLLSVRLLPLKVLITIFKYAMTFHGPFKSWCDKTSPHTLSHVCSSWHSTALSCLDFWKELDLHPSGFCTKKETTDVIGTVVHSWYGHTNHPSPLSLRVEVNEYISECMEEDFACTITTFSPQMVDIYIKFSDPSTPSDLCTFLTLLGGLFMSLESLSFITDTQHSDTLSLNNTSVTVFAHSPHLYKATLHIQINMLQGNAHLLLLWSQLTHLTMLSKTSLQSLAILLFQLCSNLESASFSHLDLGTHAEEPLGPLLPLFCVIFPHLWTFTTHLGDFAPMPINLQNNARDVFEHIKLTNVEQLELVGLMFSFNSSIIDNPFPTLSMVSPPTRG